MATPRLYNPVGTYIHPEDWQRPAGNYDFRVTSTYAEHVASGRGPGIDLGDTRCGSPILAMEAGVATEVFTAPNGAHVTRIRLDLDGGRWTQGIAHASDFLLAKGQRVARGQLCGHVGKTGATACHYHGGLTELVNGAPVERDWWPYLYQNRTAWIVAPGTNIRANQGPKGTTSPGPLFASVGLDGRIHRASDNKDLGLSSAHRGIRQPVEGATWTLPSGASGNLWLPFWLDAGWRFVALPLASISG